MNLFLFYLSAFILGLGLHTLVLISLLTGLGPAARKSLARKLATIALVAVGKPVWTVNQSNELTQKQRQYDEETDQEYITFGGLLSSTTRWLRDPQNRLHRFGPVRFAFVDEFSGLVFDARDADAGREAKRHEENGELEVTQLGGKSITHYIRGVFEFPGESRGVRLQDAIYLIGGSSDAQTPEWIDSIYEDSQEPRSERLSTWELLTPVFALLGVLVFGAVVGGSGGGGGGGAPSIGVGILGLILVPAGRWRSRGVTLLFTLAVVGGVALVFMLFPGGIAWPLLASLAAGMVILPATAWFLGSALGGLGGALSTLYWIIALKIGFKEPVVYLEDDDTYTIEEYEDLSPAADPEWYRFAKSWIGVAYENSEDAWPKDAAFDSQDLEDYEGASRSILPKGTVRTGDPAIKSGGHIGFIPDQDHREDGAVYLDTRHPLSWFRNVARGFDLVRALKESKEDNFGGHSPDQKFVQYATIAFVVVGLVIDVFMFF